MKHAFNARTKRLIWQSSKVWFPALKAFSWFWLLDPSKSGGIKNHVGDLIWQDHVLSHKLGSKIGQIPWKTKLFGKNYKTTILFTNSWIQIYENESLTVTSLWSQEIPESHSHDRKYNFNDCSALGGTKQQSTNKCLIMWNEQVFKSQKRRANQNNLVSF